MLPDKIVSVGNSISIPKVDIKDNKIQLAQVCNNSGDFDEIITDISLYFVENYQMENENNIHISELKELVLLKKKETIQNIFESNLDFHRTPYDFLLMNDKTYTVVLRISFVSNDNHINTNDLKIGMIKIVKNSDTGLISGDIQFISQYKKIDFNHSKPILIITNIPRTIEYDAFELDIVD